MYTHLDPPPPPSLDGDGGHLNTTFGDTMTGPDPQFITQQNWQQIGSLLMPLWYILGAALGMAFSFLTAHGLIPSLTATRELPAKAEALRAPLYGLSFVFLVLVLFSVFLFVDRLDVISQIFWQGAQ